MANAKAKGVRIGRPQATADDIPQIFLRHYPSYKNGSLKALNLREFVNSAEPQSINTFLFWSDTT